MNAIDKYKKEKRELGYSESWRDLIGSPYSGGGGGIGMICNAYIHTITVYHQPYDGANNYHEMPESLKPFFNQVLKSEGKSLIDKAVSLQRDTVIRLADECAKELEAAMKDAGLEVIQ